MRVALVLPPLTQLNTPYPSIAYLARHLRDEGHQTTQRDLGIELVLQVFSKAGLRAIFAEVEKKAEAGELPDEAWRFLALQQRHLGVIDAVIRFLQGRDPSLATRVLDTPFLPLGPRLEAADTERFGPMGVLDAARYLCTLYLADLADLVTATVDEGFGLARYQHHLAVGPISFDPLAERLAGSTLLDGWLDALTDSLLLDKPDVAAISVPFPGTLYGALRIGRRLKAAGVYVVMGGGYVNTELREVSEPRLFENIDALCYDDGEAPLSALLRWKQGGPDARLRTRTAEAHHESGTPAPPFNPAPWYGDLRLDRYLQVIDTLSPGQRIWSEARWNKLTVAHGCYWKRCAFCDIQLDYIRRYEPARVSALVDHMERLIEETGVTGFHLVDEALPPRLLRDLAIEVLRRDLAVSFWGNIRFERAWTPDLCRLLASAGLIAVTGGLEVASDRLLKLMDKGITIEQAARAAHAFRSAGVLVHAYLMYGFPTQTAQETVDSAEVVRQMFAADLLSSAFWHRFVLTRHSAVYQRPRDFSVRFTPPRGTFASNDIPHEDPTGADHDLFDQPLAAALSAWMKGEELEKPVDTWFPDRMPRSREPRERIARAIAGKLPSMEPNDRLIWTGGDVLDGDGVLVLHSADQEVEIKGEPAELAWLSGLVEAASPGAATPLLYAQAEASFPGEWRRFERRWQKVRAAGMLGV
jgi:hypothetical protein